MSDPVRLPASVQTIPEALAFWAETTPHAPALVIPGCPAITYAALWRSAQTLAGSLRRLAVGRQERIVLLVPDGPELAVALMGTVSAAIAIPVSPTLPGPELDAALRGLRAAGAIVSPSLPAPARASLTQDGVPVFDLRPTADPWTFILAGHTRRPPSGDDWPRPDDVAVVNQTSGTSGRPKRVPRTHESNIQGGRIQRDRFSLDQRDRALSVVPLTTTLGRTSLINTIVAGGALVCPPERDMSRLWDCLVAERATWMYASAGFLELLARFLRADPARPSPPSLRFARVTAAPISPDMCAELAKRLDAPILPSYSASETGTIAMALPPPARHRPGSTGVPVLEVRIVDDDRGDVGPGKPGEIWVRGPRVFAGYLDDPETNASVFMPGGWFRTGDVGYLDDDGFLFLTGRVTELINRGGDKIAPVEVDAALRLHPAVNEAATFSVPDERLGEDLVAAVVLERGAAPTPRELRRWLLDRLSPHKVPRRIWIRDDLPRTPTGKVQRRELARRWVEAHL